MNILHQAIVRNGVQIYIPSSLHSAIEQRVQIFEEDHVSLLINVGGNQASLGNCSHASSIPNGYHASLRSCLDDDRGVMMRMSERGVPVIHLLNIRSLAARYGIPLIPGADYTSGDVYYTNRVKHIPVIISSFIIVLSTLLVARIHRM
jgi:poly-gamma-glutamate system protein